MSSTKTRTIKEVVTLKTHDDSKVLSVGDNWTCPCMAGVFRAKEPPGHKNCDRHKSFMKWKEEEDKKTKEHLRELSDKLSRAESSARDWEQKCIFNSKEFFKYRTWWRNAEEELCMKKRTITDLEKYIAEKDGDLENRNGEIRILYENLDYMVERKRLKKMAKVNRCDS